MTEKRRHPRFALNCSIWVESKRLIQGFIDDISESGIKIRLTDTIKDASFYKKDLKEVHSLQLLVDECLKIEVKSKLVRVEENDNKIFLCYQFINPTKILDYIF